MDPSSSCNTEETKNQVVGVVEEEKDEKIMLEKTDSNKVVVAVESSAAAAAVEEDPWEERVMIVRKHFEQKGYRVHSGLQFGCELVLYADDPSRVHSDFGVRVVPEDGRLDWRCMQTLVRSMPDFHKTLILANVVTNKDNNQVVVEELAMATEHAPFRHKKASQRKAVGSQRKKTRTDERRTITTTSTTTDADGVTVKEKEETTNKTTTATDG